MRLSARAIPFASRISLRSTRCCSEGGGRRGDTGGESSYGVRTGQGACLVWLFAFTVGDGKPATGNRQPAMQDDPWLSVHCPFPVAGCLLPGLIRFCSLVVLLTAITLGVPAAQKR